MKQTNQIATLFREVMLNGKWVAFINWKEALEDVEWQQAIQKVEELNTIAALTFHINYYIAGVLNVFEGGALEIRDKYSFDMPPVESAADWEQLRATLLDNAEKFAAHLDQLMDDQLDTPFVDEKYGQYRRNMHGMIEHCYYHLGQVVMLKKLTRSKA
ncbi:MAG: DinB family protein [Bacteroidota bacterium]